ncbi:hypothetical protein J7L02_04285 [Candidatus Woesearchaeota archaeon]|nr:hypothetical protein [Candidatus Woesearchaeota archaeon]
MADEIYVVYLQQEIEKKPLIRDVTEKIVKEPGTSIEELIKYSVKPDPSFTDDDKRLATAIKQELEKTQGVQDMYLHISVIDENGLERVVTSPDGTESSIVKPEWEAKPYFKKVMSPDGEEYNHLGLVVTARPTAGNLSFKPGLKSLLEVYN